MQQAYGKDRLAVLLLSVDPEYFPKQDSYAARAKQIYTEKKVDWPNVFLPGGWTDAARTLNAGGYGLTLVDGRGIVRAVNIRPDDLDRVVGQVVGKKDK